MFKCVNISGELDKIYIKMDSQVRKRKNKGAGKEKDLHDLSTKLGNIIPDRRDGVSFIVIHTFFI